MTRAALVLAIGMVGCCTTTPPAPLIVPVGTVIPAHDVCPSGVAAPPTPLPPRAIDELVAWGTNMRKALAQTQMALHATEQARRDCADKLGRLNEWIAVVLTP